MWAQTQREAYWIHSRYNVIVLHDNNLFYTQMKNELLPCGSEKDSLNFSEIHFYFYFHRYIGKVIHTSV